MSEGIVNRNISADIAPWLPEKNFWQENLPTIDHIFEVVRSQFPDHDPPLITSENTTHPSDDVRNWMWKHFMGHQHGSQQGFGDKIPLTIDKEGYFWPDLARLQYGLFSFVAPCIPPSGEHYDKAYILGGSTAQNTNRLLAALGNKPQAADVDETIFLAGQRLRWDIPGEMDISDIYSTVASDSGVDIDRLREFSPWVQEEERKAMGPTNEWDRPYATEFHLGRLAVEAVFIDVIDWREYPVTIHDDENPVSLRYTQDGGIKYTAPREVSHVTYELKDGRRAHVMNGKPVPRPQGDFPKPTSDSTVRETVELIGTNRPSEAIIIGTSVPHVRAGIDAFIRLLDLKGGTIGKMNIAAGRWEYGNELLAALGEIPATYKADQRLRAVLRGENPDSNELMAL